MRDDEAKRHDAEFMLHFALILGGLVVFIVFCAVAARAVSPTRTDLKEIVNSPEAIAERIAPAGRLLMEGAELPQEGTLAEEPVFEAASAPAAAAPPAAGAAGAVASAAGAGGGGEGIYVEACQLCHGVGLAGAPKPGDASAWESRIAQGLDTVYHNALQGIRGMPAKGGRLDLSDDQVREAVDFMLK